MFTIYFQVDNFDGHMARPQVQGKDRGTLAPVISLLHLLPRPVAPDTQKDAPASMKTSNN